MNKNINTTIEIIKNKVISDERKTILNELTNYINLKIEKEALVNLNFICTHNSRRSHLAQIWMQTLAYHFGIQNLNCYSGGTEATAVAKPILTTLQAQGFEIGKLNDSENPTYFLKYSANSHPIIGFSKAYDHDFNPKSDYAAIMVCSQADEGCPFVVGAETRIKLTFEDPKISDNTPEEAEIYAQRSIEIASELYYVLSKLNV